MEYLPLLVEMRKDMIELEIGPQGGLFANFQVSPILVERVIASQLEVPVLWAIRLKVENGTRTDYAVRKDGALVAGTRLCVPKGNIGGGPLFALHYASEKHQNVPHTYRVLLMAPYEAGHSRVCEQVFTMPTG
ncbi:hypothetical protein ACE6H2_006420 [Prunus campanulata]